MTKTIALLSPCRTRKIQLTQPEVGASVLKETWEADHNVLQDLDVTYKRRKISKKAANDLVRRLSGQGWDRIVFG